MTLVSDMSPTPSWPAAPAHLQSDRRGGRPAAATMIVAANSRRTGAGRSQAVAQSSVTAMPIFSTVLSAVEPGSFRNSL